MRKVIFIMCLGLFGPLCTANAVNGLRYSENVPLKTRLAIDHSLLKISNLASLRFVTIKIFDGNVRSGIMAFVQPALYPHHIFLTREFLEKADGLSRFEIADIILHESHHLKGQNHTAKHVRCPKTDLNGMLLVGVQSGRRLEGIANCDASDKSPFAQNAQLFISLAKTCTRCSLEEKKEILKVAQNDMSRVIDKSIYERLLRDFKIQAEKIPNSL